MNVGQVNSIGMPGGVGAPGTVARSSQSGGVPFSQMMSQFLADANQQQQAVSDDVKKLITGEADNIHDVAITMAQADISFRIFMEVRDQLISAYQEVMRMQV